MGRKLKENRIDSLDNIFKTFKNELHLHREQQKEIVERFKYNISFLKNNHNTSIDKTFARDVRRVQLEDNKKSCWKLPSIIGSGPFRGKNKKNKIKEYCDCSVDGSDTDIEVDDDDDDDDDDDEDEKKDQRHINAKGDTARIQRKVRKGRKYPLKPRRKNVKKKQSLAKLEISSISRNELTLKQNLLHLIRDTGDMNGLIPMTEQQNLELPGPSGHSGPLVVNMPMGCNPVKKKAFEKHRKK